ncbi:MAG: hypothetical protein NE330_19600, partial [Lentisphaeraceae bacterium]|nr:hypothetical protein [Lentisphaeraceae bacterium]
ASTGKLMMVGDQQNLVDVTYVENGALAHIQAADKLSEGSPVCGQAYFIGDAKPVNLWEWVNELLEKNNIPALTKTISYNKAKKVGAVLEFFYKLLRLKGEPRMTRFVAAQLAKSHYFSHKKALDHFGFDPKINNDEGLKRTLEWLKKA